MKRLLLSLLTVLISSACIFAQTNKRVIIHINGDKTPYSFITSQIDSITFAENVPEATVKLSVKDIKEKSATIFFELTNSQKVIYTYAKSEDVENWSEATLFSYLRNFGNVSEASSAKLENLTEDTEYTVIAAAYDAYNAICRPAYQYFATQSPSSYKFTITPEFQSIKVGERAIVELYADGVPYDGDFEVKWEVSTPTSLIALGNGVFAGIGYGTNIVRATIGENEAVAEIEVIDKNVPTEYDEVYFMSPYPYLEYPTTRERIMAAEAACQSQGYILRYPVNTEGDVITYQLCNYFSKGPAYVIFSHTFYNLNAQKGEPIAWGYMQGLRDETMYPAFSDIIKEFGFEWNKNIVLENGTTAAWYKNEKLNRSCLVYVRPYDSDPSQKYGIAEFRVLSDDENNTSTGEPGETENDLPMGFDKWGASPDEIKAYEAENGSVYNENAIPEDKRKLMFDINSTAENGHIIRRDYLFSDWIQYSSSYYYYHTTWLKKECNYVDDNNNPTAEMVERLKRNGYIYKEENGTYYNATRQVEISFQSVPGYLLGRDEEIIVGLNFKYIGERTQK